MRSSLYLCAFLAVAISQAGCEPTSGEGEARASAEATPAPRPRPQTQRPTFTIIEEERIPGVKCSLTVRLEEKVSEAQLEEIATFIKAMEPRQYDRFFIAYLLPEMQVDAGAWATTHWDPDLEVTILGASIEDEQELRANEGSEADGADAIGSWIDETPFAASRIDIYRKDGSIWMYRNFEDGSDLLDELTEIGNKFHLPDHGEWVQIDSAGRLLWYDREGLIKAVRPIE